MLDRLNSDLLLTIFNYCTPEDILELSLISKRFNSFVNAYERHLPRFNTNCAVKLNGEHEIKIRLWPCKDNFVSVASTKQIIYLPRVNPNNKTLVKNLSRYKITSLTLYGTGNQKVQIGLKFVEWLTSELQPDLEYISLKNLNLCDVNTHAWTKFLSLFSSNCKFSTINCTFPYLSMIYQLYERQPMFNYLTETYTTIIENDISIEDFEHKNRQILRNLVNGSAASLDLSSLGNLTLDLVLEFIQYWINSPSPNDFSYLCLWKNFDSSQLQRQIGHGIGQQLEGGLLEFQHCANSDLRLYVDTQQRLFLNMCVKRANRLL